SGTRLGATWDCELLQHARRAAVAGARLPRRRGDRRTQRRGAVLRRLAAAVRRRPTRRWNHDVDRRAALHDRRGDAASDWPRPERSNLDADAIPYTRALGSGRPFDARSRTVERGGHARAGTSRTGRDSAAAQTWRFGK